MPADFSSAAFFIVAALLVPGSEVVAGGRRHEPDPDRPAAASSSGWAPRSRSSRWDERGGEPVGTIRVRASELRGTEVGGDEVPLAIDELPLVALAACFAEGETTIRDAAELRRKESDRVATTCEALTALGATAEPREDGMRIEGGGGLRGGTIDSHGDHRIAMLGAVAGLASREGVEVEGMDAAAVSYPGFEADLASLLGWQRLTRRPARLYAAADGHRDRRARRGRQVNGCPRARGAARLHLPRLGGDVSLRGAGRARARRSTSTTRRRWGRLARSLAIELDGERVELDGRDVSEAIRDPRVTDASSRVSVHPAVREAMVAASAS